MVRAPRSIGGKLLGDPSLGCGTVCDGVVPMYGVVVVVDVLVVS